MDPNNRRTRKVGRWLLVWNSSRPNLMDVYHEAGSLWTDQAIRYPHNGQIAYDFPERIPATVQRAVRQFFRSVLKRAS